MMELHEENKLMRKALEHIAPRMPHSIIAGIANAALAAVGPAAQPEGEAAPSVDIPFELRELLSQHADERNQGMAGPAMNAIYAWHQAKLAEADRAQANLRIAYAQAAERCEQRAEKAEAEATRCAKEWADAVCQRQPAPQAGDALELPPLPAPWGTMYGNSDSGNERDGYTADQMRGYAIDASRREAYDKGRAEGVGQAGQEPVHFARIKGGTQWIEVADPNVEAPIGFEMEIRTYYAAPPASAAQQVAK